MSIVAFLIHRYAAPKSNLSALLALYWPPPVSQVWSASGGRGVRNSSFTGDWSKARPPRQVHSLPGCQLAPSASFQVFLKFSGVLPSTVPSLRVKVRFWIADQPVHWRSPITSQRLSSVRKYDRLKMSGILTSDVMLVLLSLAFTPLASCPITGASAGGNAGSAGFANVALPLK